MKNTTFIIIGFLLITAEVAGQQIYIDGLYGRSSAKEFKNSWGYDLGYNYFSNKNRFGISFKQYFYYTNYDDFYFSRTYGEWCFDKYEPQNMRMGVNLTYSYKLLENKNSNLFLGASAGLNYYIFRGRYTRIVGSDIGEFRCFNERINRYGLGVLLEYELKHIIWDRVSMSAKINPEFTNFDRFLSMGGRYWFIGWANFSVGLKYQLQKNAE